MDEDSISFKEKIIYLYEHGFYVSLISDLTTIDYKIIASIVRNEHTKDLVLKYRAGYLLNNLYKTVKLNKSYATEKQDKELNDKIRQYVLDHVNRGNTYYKIAKHLCINSQTLYSFMSGQSKSLKYHHVKNIEAMHHRRFYF